MLEAPPLPCLPPLSLSLYMSVVCNKRKGHYLWGRITRFACMVTKSTILTMRG